MTPVLHQPAAPRLPGCLDGTAKTRYGEPGDRCHHPGCSALLSAYNDRDRCACHGVGGGRRKPRVRGEVASAGGSVVTNAAPPPRHVSTSEVDMAAEKRRAASDARQRVLAALTGEYNTAPRISTLAEVNQANTYYHLKCLCEEGRAENKLGNGGGYRLRQMLADFDEVQYPASSEDEKSANAPEAPPGAAPVDPPTVRAPEPPAGPAAPVTPSMTQESPAAGIVPFAGGFEELAHLHCAVPVTVAVDFDLDEIVERVMARIAERMVGR